MGIAYQALCEVHIGARLTANYIVEGGARRSGNVPRVNVSLIDTSDGIEVWGNTYEDSGELTNAA